MSRKGSFIAALCLGMLYLQAALGSLPTREEVLTQVYPEATFQPQRLFLTKEQQDRVRELSGETVESRMVARYLALQDGRGVGRAYVDTHIVRTKKETLLICLDAGGRVLRIEVTAFLEPREYQAPRLWYQQYQQGVLEDDLQVGRRIRTLTGATLTARVANQAVRRVLALDQILSDGVLP